MDQRRRMELHKLHVLQCRACATGGRDTVARGADGVCAVPVHSADSSEATMTLGRGKIARLVLPVQSQNAGNTVFIRHNIG